jgi:hypothetical protein
MSAGPQGGPDAIDNDLSIAAKNARSLRLRAGRAGAQRRPAREDEGSRSAVRRSGRPVPSPAAKPVDRAGAPRSDAAPAPSSSRADLRPDGLRCAGLLLLPHGEKEAARAFDRLPPAEHARIRRLAAVLVARRAEAAKRAAGWTADRVAALTRLFARGLSHGLIAEALGLERGAVSAKLKRLGLRRAVPTADARRGFRPGGRPLPKGRNVRLEQLTGCRWPTGPDSERALFCDRPRGDHPSYCPGHARAARAPDLAGVQTQPLELWLTRHSRRIR